MLWNLEIRMERPNAFCYNIFICWFFFSSFKGIEGNTRQGRRSCSLRSCSARVTNLLLPFISNTNLYRILVIFKFDIHIWLARNGIVYSCIIYYIIILYYINICWYSNSLLFNGTATPTSLKTTWQCQLNQLTDVCMKYYRNIRWSHLR